MADEKCEVRGAGLRREEVTGEDGSVKLALLVVHTKPPSIGFHWLPELFWTPMPEDLREEIVKRLRMDADLLESGELERKMRQFTTINQAKRVD